MPKVLDKEVPKMGFFHEKKNKLAFDFLTARSRTLATGSVARSGGIANLFFIQLCWRLTQSALLRYSDSYSV